MLQWWWGGWCLSLKPAWRACLCPFQLVRDGDPARAGEVAALLGLCLRSERCGSYLLPVLGGSACPGGYPCAWWLPGAVPVPGVLMNLNPRVGWRALPRCLVHLKRSAYARSCRAWPNGKQSRSVKRSLATKIHHQNSPAPTCRLMLRAAVSCCLSSCPPELVLPSPAERSDVDLLGQGERKVG